MSVIAACGNDCSVCPRYMPKTKEELHKTAELWYKIGYRDHVVSNDEIQCFGCTPDNWCRYQIVNCTAEKKIDNCGCCPDYPCGKIHETFEKTKEFIPNCKSCCTAEEYQIMEEAFFKKKENLDRIKNADIK